MKMRKQFSLEKPEFTEQSDEEGRLISNQLIEMYNKEYSLMLGQTKNFFADCKDIITRFITLNNLGIGFNLPLILSTFMRVQNETVSPNGSKKQIGHWEQKKKKFEGNFTSILQKMGDVIEELLNFEVRIKSAYLGEAFSSPTKMKTRFNIPAPRSRKSSFSAQFNPKSMKYRNSELNQNPEQQQMLRNILQKGMIPSSQSKQPVCSLKSSPCQNLDKLSTKIASLKQQIESSRAKQQKIWGIFNEKRPSRNMFAEVSVEEDEKDKQFKKLNEMLSDLVSQKNMSYYASPYETVDSSFRF